MDHNIHDLIYSAADPTTRRALGRSCKALSGIGSRYDADAKDNFKAFKRMWTCMEETFDSDGKPVGMEFTYGNNQTTTMLLTTVKKKQRRDYFSRTVHAKVVTVTINDIDIELQYDCHEKLFDVLMSERLESSIDALNAKEAFHYLFTTMTRCRKITHGYVL